MKMEILFEGNKKIYARIENRIIETDQPISHGGEDTAPSPFDLFLASIGTCAGFYVKSFCDQRNIPSENIRIIQSTDYNNELKLVDKISLEIRLPEDFPDKYRNAVIAAANQCTVKKHLMNPPLLEVVSTKQEELSGIES